MNEEHPSRKANAVAVHFTTADLNNLADGKYEFEAVASRLRTIGAVVLFTEEHLMEWVPLAADSRERRFALADRFPRSAFVDWDTSTTWSNSMVSTKAIVSDDLRGWFYTDSGEVQDWLLQRRLESRMVGEAEFFSRQADLMKGKESFDSSSLDRFHSLNAKHGSDLSEQWTKMVAAVPLVKAAYESIPEESRAELRDAGMKLAKQLRAFKPTLHAGFEGVSAQNRPFQLWWTTREKLRAKPAEVGGLSEEIDLTELKLWPMCIMMTFDKRVHNAIFEAIRELGWNSSNFEGQLIRGGSAAPIIAALDRLISLLEAARAAAEVGT